MSWMFLLQISILMAEVGLWSVMIHGTIVDKRREDAYKRKGNGL